MGVAREGAMGVREGRWGLEEARGVREGQQWLERGGKGARQRSV